MSDFDVAIIGAGIVGCTLAYELSQKNKKIIVLEKNESVNGPNQSSRNSGVIHAGIYYSGQLMPLKAKLCVGRRLLFKSR